MKAATDETLTVSVEEAARKLGVGKDSIYRAARRGEFPVVRIGACVRVPKARLEKLLSGDK